MIGARQPLRLIGVFKLVKAAVLLVSLAALLKVVHLDDPIHAVIGWSMRLHVDPDNYYLRLLLEKLIDLHGFQLDALALGTLIYAVTFAAEGVGLLFDSAWAKYLTLVETAGFIPLEIYEIVHEVSALKCSVLMLNLAVVLYLARTLQLDAARK